MIPKTDRSLPWSWQFSVRRNENGASDRRADVPKSTCPQMMRFSGRKVLCPGRTRWARDGASPRDVVLLKTLECEPRTRFERYSFRDAAMARLPAYKECDARSLLPAEHAWWPRPQSHRTGRRKPEPGHRRLLDMLHIFDNPLTPTSVYGHSRGDRKRATVSRAGSDGPSPRRRDLIRAGQAHAMPLQCAFRFELAKAIWKRCGRGAVGFASGQALNGDAVLQADGLEPFFTLVQFHKLQKVGAEFRLQRDAHNPSSVNNLSQINDRSTSSLS